MGELHPAQAPFQQYAALPYTVRDGELLVALITSRQSGRWIIPKGWPVKTLRGSEVAAREAYEEAGLRGEVDEVPLSSFRYAKRMGDGVRKLCHVEVYALAVHEVLDDWPERHQRKREWLTPGQAAMRVTDAGLIQLMLDLTDYGEDAAKPVGRSMISFR